MTLAILAILPFTQALSGDPRDRTFREVGTANIPPPEPPPPEPPPPPEEEEEQKPEMEPPPPMLDISMMESMLNPGTGGVTAGGFDFSSISGQTSLEEAIVYSLVDLDRRPRIIKGGRLNFPIELQRSGVKGVVRVTVRINQDGFVSIEDIRNSPDPRLTEVLRQQIPEWRYESPTVNGEPVTAEYIQPLEIDFSG